MFELYWNIFFTYIQVVIILIDIIHTQIVLTYKEIDILANKIWLITDSHRIYIENRVYKIWTVVTIYISIWTYLILHSKQNRYYISLHDYISSIVD